jgi:GAF domain-containing protein
MSEHPMSEASQTDDFADCETAERCLWKVLMVVCPQLNVQAGTFFELDAAREALRVGHTWGILPWRVAKGEFPLSRGICGWVAQHRQPVIVNEVKKDARFNKQIDLVTQFETVSVLCAPFIAGSELVGVVELINRPQNPFTEADLAHLQTVLRQAVTRYQELAA